MADKCYKFSTRDDTTWVCSDSGDGDNVSSESQWSVFHVTLNVEVENAAPETDYTIDSISFLYNSIIYENGSAGVYNSLDGELAVGENSLDILAYQGETTIEISENGANTIVLSDFSQNVEDITEDSNESHYGIVKLTGDASFTVKIVIGEESQI